MGPQTSVGYRELRDDLLRRIRSGEYPVSSRLPSIVATSQEAKVSYLTAQRAYRLLAEEGILSVSRGRGRRSVVLRDTPLTSKRSLVIGGLFRPFQPRNESNNYGLDMYESACRRLVEDGASVLPRKLPDVTADAVSAESLLNDIEHKRVDGVLLDEPAPDEVVEQVAATGCPAVLYARHALQAPIDSVSSDYEWAGRMTARKILEAGYERVVFWRDFRPDLYVTPSGKARAFAFSAYTDAAHRALDEGGMPPDRIVSLFEGASHEEDFKWYSPAGVLGVLDELDLERGPRTALVALADPLALGAYAGLRERGLRVPEDCGVIGRFDHEVNRHAEHPVSTWRISPNEIGRVAVEALMQRIEFPERERVRRYLTPVFVDHGTL